MRVWIITNSFPPVNVTAVHRTLSLCRHLAQAGREVLVLTSPPGAGQPLDEQLLAKVPPQVRVIRQARWAQPPAEAPRAPGRGANAAEAWRPGGGAVRQWLAHFLLLPDSRVDWLAPALWRGLAEARQQRPDVIYSTAPAWTNHLVGMALCRRLGVPWVADFRDPWCANPFRQIPYRLHRIIDSRLERRCIHLACGVICNTDAARADFQRRYPRLADRFVTIHNGFDSEDILLARSAPAEQPNGHCRFVHAGSFYGQRSPMPLLEALAEVLRRRADLRGLVRLRQIGPPLYDQNPIDRLAAGLGLDDVVELAGSMPYAQALREVHRCEVAVVAGHSGPGSDLQVPRKVYEYLGLGKPILVTGGTARAVSRLTGERECLWLAEGEGERQVQAIAQACEAIVDQWRDGLLPRQLPPMECFSAEQMARRIDEVLVRAAAGPRGAGEAAC